MDAWRRWKALGRAISAAGGLREVFRDLVTRYGESGRAYHTLRHVLSCLAELDRGRHLCKVPLAVELALWFHDAIYDPRASDNEARSAALLHEAAAAMGLDSGLARAAAGLVMATAHFGGAPAGAGDAAAAAAGDAAPGGGARADAAITSDIDLGILGAPPRAYASYEKAIRTEYSFLSDAEWIAGRTRVLATFLARPHIFLTAELREHYESRARENIARSLRELSLRAGAPPSNPPPR